jgi:hypothetical protein
MGAIAPRFLFRFAATTERKVALGFDDRTIGVNYIHGALNPN